MTNETNGQEWNRELEMYLRLAADDSYGGVLEPKEQTPENLRSLTNLQEAGLIRSFHINSSEEIEQVIKEDKANKGVSIENILVMGYIPHAAMPEDHYKEVRRQLNKLNIRFTPYSRHIIHGALDNIGLGFLGYTDSRSVQLPHCWDKSNEILVFEHFLYKLHLDPTLRDYEAPFRFTKEGLYDFARNEKVIEGEKEISLTSLGKKFVQSITESFDRLSKVPNMNPKWAKCKY